MWQCSPKRKGESGYLRTSVRGGSSNLRHSTYNQWLCTKQDTELTLIVITLNVPLEIFIFSVLIKTPTGASEIHGEGKHPPVRQLCCILSSTPLLTSHQTGSDREEGNVPQQEQKSSYHSSELSNNNDKSRGGWRNCRRRASSRLAPFTRATTKGYVTAQTNDVLQCARAWRGANVTRSLAGEPRRREEQAGVQPLTWRHTRARRKRNPSSFPYLPYRRPLKKRDF